MDIKELTKLAKACRKLGISHLKTPECEIILDAHILNAKPKARKRKVTTSPVNDSLMNEPDAEEQNQELSELDLLFWSSERAQ